MKFWTPKLSAIMGRLPQASSEVHPKSPIEEPQQPPTRQTTNPSTADSVTKEDWVLVNSARHAHVPVAVDTGRRPTSSSHASPESLREGTGPESKDERFWTVDDIYNLHHISKRNAAELRKAAKDAQRDTFHKLQKLKEAMSTPARMKQRSDSQAR